MYKFWKIRIKRKMNESSRGSLKRTKVVEGEFKR